MNKRASAALWPWALQSRPSHGSVLSHGHGPQQGPHVDQNDEKAEAGGSLRSLLEHSRFLQDMAWGVCSPVWNEWRATELLQVSKDSGPSGSTRWWGRFGAKRKQEDWVAQERITQKVAVGNESVLRSLQCLGGGKRVMTYLWLWWVKCAWYIFRCDTKSLGIEYLASKLIKGKQWSDKSNQSERS